jgi:hypothetical protein
VTPALKSSSPVPDPLFFPVFSSYTARERKKDSHMILEDLEHRFQELTQRIDLVRSYL